MSSTSLVLSCISRKGYAAARSQTRVSSLNLYCCRHYISSSLSSYSTPDESPYPKSPPSAGRIRSPWLMLPSSPNGKDYKFYRLAEKQVVSFDRTNIIGGEIEIESESESKSKRRRSEETRALVGSSHGWLAFFDRSEDSTFLTDPVSGRNIKLPPIDTLIITRRDWVLEGTVTSVVISGSPDRQEEECRAMMIYSWRNMLAFCCPGRSLEWTPIGNLYNQTSRRSYESVVYSTRQKLFFCLTETETETEEFEAWDLTSDPSSRRRIRAKSVEFEAWDLSDPRSPRRISMDDVKVDQGKSLLAYPDITHRQFLVMADHSGELFFVRQFVTFREEMATNQYGGYLRNNGTRYKTIGFDVHIYDPAARAFNFIDTSGSGGSSLDGLALFIGANHGFAIPADEYPELRPNSIYFTDKQYARELCKEYGPIFFFDRDDDREEEEEEEEEDKEEKRDFGGHDVGIFNYEDGTFSPCYPSDYPTIKNIRTAPTWFTPNPHI